MEVESDFFLLLVLNIGHCDRAMIVIRHRANDGPIHESALLEYSSRGPRVIHSHGLSDQLT